LKSKYSPQELKSLLVGVVNLQFTPFTPKGNIDESALRENTNFMIENGIVTGRGVQMIGGQVGEGAYLSDREFRQLIDIVVKEAAGRVPIGVATLRQSTRSIIDLAKYADEAGADFVLVMPPFYQGNIACPPDIVVEHYRAIADAIDIGIMIHHDPKIVGQTLSTELVARLMEIEKIIAWKEDRMDFGGLRELCYRFRDRLMINANTYKIMIPLDYQAGIAGHNSFLPNVDPAFALRMHAIALSGDFQRAQELFVKTIDLYSYATGRGSTSIIEFGKEMARIAGRPMGSERLPHKRPAPSAQAKLREFMLQAGMTVK
jgi:4-hydroxy-tetrahydrodipicolinate synthase